MTSYEKIQLLLSRSSEQSDITWVFTGDSITQGVIHLNGYRDYVQLFEERVRCELDRYHDVVIRSAIRGWSADNILADIDRRILRHKPQVLSIMLGMNDSCSPAGNFRNNLNDIIDKAEEISEPALILHTTNPVWPQVRDFRINLDECNDIIREIARQRSAVLVDNAEAWAKAIESNPRRLDFWVSDPVHPNSYGHIAIAEELFRQLDIFDSQSVMCRLFKP